MKFRQIRSATAIVTFADTRFLVDPWLAPKDTFPPIPGSANPDLRCPVHPLPVPVEEIIDVDAVLATHLHFDHFDEAAMEALPKSMPVFAQDETDAAVLKARGFTDVRALTFSGVEFRGITLTKTGCHHGIPGVAEVLYEKMNMRMEACGIVFRHPEEPKCFYLMGDTIWCDYTDAAIRLHKPDIIAVNAARAAIEPFGRIIMGLEDLAEVRKAAPEATLIATHMDNVGHATLWRKDLRAYVAENHLESRLLIPEDGETLTF